MIVRLGLLAVIGAMAAGAWFTIGPGAAAPTGACTSTSSPSLDTAPDWPDPPAVAWTAAELPIGLDDGGEQIMLDVAVIGGGFVAVGRDSSGPQSHAFVLHSDDGQRWSEAPGDDMRFDRTEISTLVSVGDHLYGIGSASTDDRGGSRVAVWKTDDGRSWRQAAGPFDDAYPSALAGDDQGLLMLGGDTEGRLPRAWRSADGLAWEAQPLELPVAAAAVQFGELVAVNGGWMAAGSISSGRDGPSAPVVWRSADGVRWSCHTLDAGGSSRGHAASLYRSGHGWLLVGDVSDGCGFGASCPGYRSAWVSPDGIAWSDALLDADPIRMGSSAYAGAEAGMLGVGNGTWLSPDGRDWVRVSDGETSGGLGGQTDAVVMTDDGTVVAVGTLHDRLGEAGPWIAVGELRFGEE